MSSRLPPGGGAHDFNFPTSPPLAQAAATKLAMKAGIERAKIEDAERDRGERRHYMGRKPSFDRAQLNAVRDLLGKGLGVSETAKQARVSRQTIYRIQADLAGAEAALMRWRD
jgi:DNA invertase Pin-like site-specific DNA recombinase